MKKALKTIIICVLALSFALGGLLIPGILHNNANGLAYPTLTANIISPANGTTVRVGSCFQVSATITIGCPELIQNNTEDYFFARPVHAGIGYGVDEVGATIAIAGNATVQGSATLSSGTGLSCPDYRIPEYPTSTTLTWTVCCTGPGVTTITVTPYGNMLLVQNFNVLTQPVYATSQSFTPLPSENLISDSITVTQISKQTTETSTSWSMPHNIRTINVWAQPQTQLAGQSVIIYANVANRGDIEGPYTATLKINGNEKAVKTGMLQGNTAVPLEFVVNCDEPGTYTVDVNGKQTFFTVVGDVEKEGVSLQNSQKLLLLWGFLLLALILALVMVVLRRRQSYD